MDIWTGIVCLVADPARKVFRRFGKTVKGAYVNIAACAESEEHFAECVAFGASELDCLLLELDCIQLLSERMEEPDYPEELITMRSTAQRQQSDVVFGTVHLWTQSDAN